jgi:hypothetical protein
MNTDTNSNQEIINKLKGQFDNPLLGKSIKSTMASATPADVFKIKAEIRRLSTLSHRAFRVDQFFHNEDIQFTEMEMSGLVHHVEKLTEKKMISEAAIYGGLYTVGVEEAMEEYVKKHKPEILYYQKNINAMVTPLNISETIYRKEERMHLGVRCEISILDNDFLPDKTNFSKLKDNAPMLTGLTQNISSNGLRIRTQQPGMNGCLVLIRFTGLEKDFIFSQPYILYECVHSERANRNLQTKDFPHSWALKKVSHPNNREFDAFSENLIKANKLRLSVDIDNVQRSVTNSIAEQFLSNRERGLYLFKKQDNTPVLSFGNSLGKEIHDFFINNGVSRLSSLIHKDEIDNTPEGKSIMWAVIKQKDGSFFSAPINSDETRSKFYRYCLSRPDSHFFHVVRSKAEKKGAFTTHNLPSTVDASSKIKHLRRLTDFYSSNTREMIDGLGWLIHITPINKKTLTQLNSEVTKNEFSKKDLATFSTFSLKKVSKRHLPFVKMRSRELRCEDRFKLITPISIESKDSVHYGKLDDVSESGAAITLKNTPEGNWEGRQIIVKFNELNAIGNELPHVAYRVVRQKENTIFLSQKNTGVKRTSLFWPKFLDRHFNELDPVQETDSAGGNMLGLERALRNIKNSSKTDIELLTAAQGAGTSISFANFPDNAENKECWLSKRDRFHTASNNLKELFCDYDLQRTLSAIMRNVTKENPFESFLLLISEKNGYFKKAKIFFPDEMNALKLKTLTRSMRDTGESPYWYIGSITRKSRVFERYYREELNYIENCAIHRAENLHNIIKKTTGVVSLIPLNDYMCFTR